MLKTTAGDLLRHARWAQDLTIQQLADRSGVAGSTIHKAEKGGQIEGRLVYKLANALRLDVNDLFEREVAS